MSGLASIPRTKQHSCSCFALRCDQYDEGRQALICDELKRMMAKDLSDNLYEIVSKSL